MNEIETEEMEVENGKYFVLYLIGIILLSFIGFIDLFNEQLFLKSFVALVNTVLDLVITIVYIYFIYPIMMMLFLIMDNILIISIFSFIFMGLMILKRIYRNLGEKFS